jgi:hypothetical protein
MGSREALGQKRKFAFLEVVWGEIENSPLPARREVSGKEAQTPKSTAAAATFNDSRSVVSSESRPDGH